MSVSTDRHEIVYSCDRCGASRKTGVRSPEWKGALAAFLESGGWAVWRVGAWAHYCSRRCKQFAELAAK